MTAPVTFQRIWSDGMVGHVWDATPETVLVAVAGQFRAAKTPHAYALRFQMDDGSTVVAKAKRGAV